MTVVDKARLIVRIRRTVQVAVLALFLYLLSVVLLRLPQNARAAAARLIKRKARKATPKAPKPGADEQPEKKAA